MVAIVLEKLAASILSVDGGSMFLWKVSTHLRNCGVVWFLFQMTATARPLNLLTPWCRVLLEKLTGLQLVKKSPAFHGTRRFITALTSVRHLSLSWANPIQSTDPYPHLLEIHPNIIHPSTPRSPQWCKTLKSHVKLQFTVLPTSL